MPEPSRPNSALSRPLRAATSGPVSLVQLEALQEGVLVSSPSHDKWDKLPLKYGPCPCNRSKSSSSWCPLSESILPGCDPAAISDSTTCQEGATVLALLALPIHALAWRATWPPITTTSDWQSFNPRPRMEGDTPRQCRRWRPSSFQSTPSHGGRLVRDIRCANRHDVSIHALAWRATKRSSSALHVNWFQSTPSRGGRLDQATRADVLPSFQSTPSRGGRPIRCANT